MLTAAPSIKIVATILAKNEEDILDQMIQHHIQQGVSQFIVTDNNSTDSTRSIFEKYKEVVEIINEPDSTHNQPQHVTRMARMACKLNPDWIVHLDADEFWCNLTHLRAFDGPVVGCQRMYLHPPGGSMEHYLDFSVVPGIPDECKVAHRPDPDIEITHGNHGVKGNLKTVFTDKIVRHHYPIRSYDQFRQKSEGHLALKSRGSICKRWENWYNRLQDGTLQNTL